MCVYRDDDGDDDDDHDDDDDDDNDDDDNDDDDILLVLVNRAYFAIRLLDGKQFFLVFCYDVTQNNYNFKR